MAWTQTDRDNLQSAIIDLALGKRKVQSTVAGHTVEYQRSQLSEMKDLLAEMDIELGNISLRTYAKNAGSASS